MSTDNLTHSRLYHVPGSSIEALQALIYFYKSPCGRYYYYILQMRNYGPEK